MDDNHTYLPISAVLLRMELSDMFSQLVATAELGGAKEAGQLQLQVFPLHMFPHVTGLPAHVAAHRALPVLPALS